MAVIFKNNYFQRNETIDNNGFKSFNMFMITNASIEGH